MLEFELGASYDIIVALTGQVECLLGGRRLGHLPALPEEVAEGAPQQPPVGLLIVRHKHPQMRLQGDGLLAHGGVDGGGRCDRIRCGLLGAARRDGHAEAERGAARAVLSPRRLYSHLGPEELYELAAEIEPEPEPALRLVETLSPGHGAQTRE